MIAVYYIENAGPFHLYTIHFEFDVNQENINEAIIKAAKEQEYPLPKDEIVIIQNDAVVGQFIINNKNE